MREGAAEADRRYQVREAARGWQRAGAIDRATLSAIEAAYPDDRARLGPAFRILVFGFTTVAVTALAGLLGLVVAAALQAQGGILFLFFGLALAAATEFQMGTLRRVQGGTESATAWLATCYSLGGLLWLISQASGARDKALIDVALVLFVVVFAAAAYRWGYSFFAGLATIGLFLLLARFAFGRVLWGLVPLVMAPLLLRAGDSERLPPVHRRCCQAMAAVSLVFLYVAVHLGSWELSLVETLTGKWPGFREPTAIRLFFAVATALVPVLTLGWGIVARRRLLINLGLVGLLASIVTLRFYVHVAPLWSALLVGGATAIGVASILRRYLDSGPGHERHGFTAEPLFADPERRSGLEVAAGVVSFSPDARPNEPPGFKGGGGRSGGAGATGTF